MLPSVFQKGLGTLKGFKAKIYVDTDAVPRFHPARSVQRDRVDKELKRLQEEGTLEPVDISEWADPIVAVLKSDKNSVRLQRHDQPGIEIGSLSNPESGRPVLATQWRKVLHKA
jgi:hypothetical protein